MGCQYFYISFYTAAFCLQTLTCKSNSGQVTKREVMETADDDFLEAAGVVVSATLWHRKGIRVNTKAVYTQQKFNLLREEGEGFAKLLGAFNRFGAAALSPASAPGLVSVLHESFMIP